MQNEPPEWCPQWAWDEAYRLASQVVAERGTRMETFQPIVARALVSAERRGIERAAKVADKREVMSGKVAHPAAVALLQALPLAIRQLGEEP